MALRDEMLIEASAKTHIGDICGRAADELIIKEMKIEVQAREIDRLRIAIGNMHPGFDVEEAIALFGQESPEKTGPSRGGKACGC